ncbi:MAG: hypothetical protein ACXADF_14950 [Candidatus Thorarchaeota archaeon]|jgi:hypothetical protein
MKQLEQMSLKQLSQMYEATKAISYYGVEVDRMHHLRTEIRSEISVQIGRDLSNGEWSVHDDKTKRKIFSGEIVLRVTEPDTTSGTRDIEPCEYEPDWDVMLVRVIDDRAIEVSFMPTQVSYISMNSRTIHLRDEDI